MGVAFSPSGDFFASVGADEQVTVLQHVTLSSSVLHCVTLCYIVLH